MLKNIFTTLFLIFTVSLFLSCNQRRSKESVAVQDTSENSRNEIIEIAELIVEETPEYIDTSSFEERFGWRQDRGTIYNTFITAEIVNIHAGPSLQSEVRHQLSRYTRIRIFGVSKETDIIDDYEGHWLLIASLHSGRRDWIFSKYVQSENITPNEIRIVGLAPEEPRRARRLYGTFMNGDTEVQFSVRPRKLPHQPFWTFVWDHNIANFRFDTVPGSYVWFPETNETRHITHIGHTPESAWVKFTDDFKFILQDFGTGPGVRGLAAWRVDCGTHVFSGGYLDSIYLNGHTIRIANVYESFAIAYWDDELLAFAENFLRDNPEPPDDLIEIARQGPFGIRLHIFSEFDLYTKERRIIEADWILTQ